MSQAQTKPANEQGPNPLLPLFKRYPPNEILNHKYTPDLVAQIKLITNKDARLNNIQFVPPKTKNRDMEHYAEQFNFFDYLGHHYSKMINQIVYMKFDNRKYSLMADTKLRTRVMPAFYVPFQQLYSQQSIQFTQRLGLQFPVMQADSYLPTRDNNRGCSFDPRFSSAYASANLFAAVRKKPFQYDLILQNDTNSCESTGWFNFSVQFQEKGYYTFKIVNITTDMSQLFARGLKISYFNLNNFEEEHTDKVGQNWGLCGENIRFSQSAIEMQHKRGQKYYELYFEYKCKNKHDAVIFALDLPYNTMEAAKFYDKLLTKKIRGMITIDKEQYGTTIQGSPLESFTISRKRTGDSTQLYELNRKRRQKRRSANLSPFLNQTQPITDGPNKSIIVIGRLNGVDVSSSFVIEGMVEYLFQNMEFDSLKKVYNFHFFPFANVDGVKYGNHTANLTGSNLNGNWKDPHKQYQPEIFYLKEYMSEINKKCPISLVINLTGEHQNLYTSIVGVSNNTGECEDSRIYPYILSKRNRIISFEECVFMNRNQDNSMCSILSQLYPKALVYQFNISRFCTSNKMEDFNNNPLTEVELKQCNGDNYRSFGRQLIQNYLEHVKLYDKNVLLRDKWGGQIQCIENKITRKTYNFIEDKKTEDKFQEAFYIITKEKTTENKTTSTVSSNISLNSKKVITQPMIACQSVQKQQLTGSNSTYSLKQTRKKSEGYLKYNIDSIKEDAFVGKPLPKLRSNIKKTSIMNSNAAEEEAQILSQHLTKRKKDRLFVTRKQKTPNMLRKVKIADNIQGRISKQQLEQILRHS